MAYRIDYGTPIRNTRAELRKNRIFSWITIICVLILVISAIAVKQQGLPWVETYLLPGDPAVTAAALDALAEDLRTGESLTQAISTFCREIMENAG